MLKNVCQSGVIEDPVLLAMTLRNKVIGFRRFGGTSGAYHSVSQRRFAEERNPALRMTGALPSFPLRILMV